MGVLGDWEKRFGYRLCVVFDDSFIGIMWGMKVHAFLHLNAKLSSNHSVN